MEKQRSSAKVTSRSFSIIPLLICHLIVYVEFLLFLGITLFLIIYQREALLIGNESWYYYFLVPIIGCACFGVFLRLKKTWRQKRTLTIWLQIIICIVNYVIVALLLYTNNLDYSQPVPAIFTLFLCLVGLLLTNIIVLSKVEILVDLKTDKRKFLALLLALGGTWAITLCLIDVFATLTYFFIFSAIFHGAFFFLLLRDRSPDILRVQKVSKLQFGENLFRFLVQLVCLDLAWNQVGFLYFVPDSLVAAYTFFFPTIVSPLFIAGMFLAVILVRYKGEIYGDLGVFAILCLAFFDIYIFAPLLLGYALLAMAFFLKERNPSSASFAIVLTLLGSLVGLYLFFNNADVRMFDLYPLIYSMVIGFLACILGLSFVFHYFSTKRATNIKNDEILNAGGRP